MQRRRYATVLSVLGLVVGAMGITATAGPAMAAPSFQMPFPCGQSWGGNSGGSSAHRSYEIDFNRGSTATADLGDTVVASAGGIVRSAGYQTSNGYGNLVTIDHGSGYISYYAHLKRIAVKTGETVLGGQVIGALGNTSETNPGISPHLHYEVRLGSGYPGNIIRAVFNGSTFGYPAQTLTSRNCGTSYDPQALCGSGFEPNDSVRLGSSGTVNLTYNESSRKNCAVTLRFNGSSPIAMSAYLTPQGGSRVIDSGNFTSYAGPVSATAPSCVVWGGKIGTTAYTSPSEHC